MAAKLSKSINLLDPVIAPEDIWTKVYFWVSGVGRFLLVGVAIVVLSVFFARFFLDKQNNDLTNNEINPKIRTLSEPQLRKSEQLYRNFHRLISDIATVISVQRINSTRVSAVLDSIPSNFDLKNVSFSGDKVSLSLEGDRLEDIGKFTSLLNSNPSYSDVSSSVTKSGGGESRVEFTVTFAFVTSTSKK